MESHVLEGDHGPRPREIEAPYSSLTTAFLEAQCEQRLEQLSALTPLSRTGAGTAGYAAQVALVPTERPLKAEGQGPYFSPFWGSGLIFKSTPNCPESPLKLWG